MSDKPLKTYLKGIADTLRTKKKTTELISPRNFNNVIASIPGGEYDISQTDNGDGTIDLYITADTSGGGSAPEVIEKDIVENGTYIAEEDNVYGFSVVNVNVPIKEDPVLINKEITTNGEYSANDDNVDGYSTITVNVPNSEPDLMTKTVTENGTYLASNDGADGYSSINVNVVVDNEGVGSGKYVCRVIDYDGTIIKEKHLNTGSIFSLPGLPTHEGLIAQGYSSPIDIVDNKITVENSDITIGVMYTTESGCTELDIELDNATGLEVSLFLSGVKDWGDGTSDDGSSHTYTTYGKYTIKVSGFSYTAGGGIGVFGQGEGSGGTNTYCTAIRLCSEIKSIPKYAFYACKSLKTITIPNTVTSIDENVFANCTILNTLIIPNGVTTIGEYLCTNNYALKFLVLPKGIISVGAYFCQECRTLQTITLPEGLTAMPARMFDFCHSLTNVTIPGSVNTISASVFRTNADASYYNPTLIYDFSKHTEVPSLPYTNAFYNIHPKAKIIVPDTLYDEWIAATNWSDLVGYICKASEVME